LSGNILWEKTFGSVYFESGGAATITHDKKIILTGYASFDSGIVQGIHGGEDFWVIQIDTAGNFEWGKCLGGSNDEEGYDIIETADYGIVTVGKSKSMDGDLTHNAGDEDMWIVKLDPPGLFIDQPENEIMDETIVNYNKMQALRFSSRISGNMQLNIYDLLGRIIIRLDVKVVQGVNYITLPDTGIKGILCLRLHKNQYSKCIKYYSW
jgi:hypothetical protein